MARLRVLGSPSAKLRTGGYKGETSGTIELTENHKTYNVADYAEAETNVPDPVLINKAITENGTYSAEDDGADGYLEVDVNIPPPVLEHGSAIPKATAKTYAPQGAGFSDFTVEATPLEIASATPKIIQQTITPSAPAIGLSEVVVEAVTPAIDSDIQPENIKQGVDILGVQGTLSPPTLITKQITANGTYNAADDNADGYDVVTVDVLEKNTLDDYFANTLEVADISSATSIVSDFFRDKSSLINVIMPNVTRIGNNAFDGCKNLALTVLPDGITRIGSYAFYNCKNLALTVLPDGITSISDGAFRSCINLALTVLPDGITSIGISAFDGCKNLALTVLPDGITSIGNNAFYGCTNLALTVLPDGITRIGDGAFQNCTNLALTVLPDGITRIGTYVFNGCTNLTSINIPDSVTSIGSNAFKNCTNLTSINIPDSVTSIGGSAFDGCKGLYFLDLSSYTDPSTLPTLANTNALQNTPATQKVYVYDQACLDALSTMTNWSTYASRMKIKGAE